jgi:hypothetical protein
VAGAAPEVRRAPYRAQVRLLYGAIRIDLAGTIEEMLDRAAGRYSSRIDGKGDGYENHAESTGVLRDGRWTPTASRSRFVVHGREASLAVSYDWDRRVVAYESRSETFLLRRVREARDRLTVPDGLHLDDISTATLNLAEERWPPRPDGTLVTHVVRRRRGRREGMEEAGGTYGAEFVPFALRLRPEGEGGKPVAVADLTRFASWAKEDDPARIVFGPDRRPELIVCPMILGSTFTFRAGPATATG